LRAFAPQWIIPETYGTTMAHSRFQSPLKAVAGHYYAHADAFASLSADDLARLSAAESLAKVARIERFNVVRFGRSSDEVSLLNYPRFFEDAFPALLESWHVDLTTSHVSYRTYQDSLTPPILHRKELMLAEGHPRRPEFQALTKAAEAIGLFQDPTRIGFRESWLRLVRDSGYQIVGHELIPIANDETAAVPDENKINGSSVARHLTALVRYGFSAPVQALARYGLISPSVEVLDYGCGRGDDVRGLTANGIQAYGWDPHYAPDGPKREADVVNLGFVINVIEDFDERSEALRGAYALTRKVLAVAAMLVSQAAQPGRPYRDGFITSRNTFQKYYTQAQLAGFIVDVLGDDPVPVSRGVFFIFRDKDLEQNFLAGRQRNVTLLQRLERSESARVRIPRTDRAQVKYEANREALDALWHTWLRLGREPDPTEIDQLEPLIQAFGSLSRALRFTASLKDQTLLTRARESRVADLSVYLALGQFAKRKSYKHLESGVQRDIRAFFGGYNTAQLHARQQLFKIAETANINAACITAAEQGLGWLVEGRSLQLHTSLIERLPTVLRIYMACGAVLYGDVQAADLIKIHIGSGKLTLMKFDDFEGQPLPRMIERIKLNLRSQDIDIFEYGDQFEQPYLYFKSRYINEEFSRYPEQLAFDEKLANLKFFDFSDYGPTPRRFQELLEQNRWTIEGFDLGRSKTVPSLDTLCGRYLRYRHLIECGETQQRTRLANLPKESDTYTALYELAINVLDPIIEYFGSIKLTYGFCSPDLSRAISGGIAPSLDQHAAHERNRKGSYVCPRLGAAADFIVEDENMHEVVNWIYQNVSFDRLYFYGPNRPIHISFSPTPQREVVELVPTTGKKSVPRVWPKQPLR
jgi:DNA phosphorothioation-associated putative methyltransferase